MSQVVRTLFLCRRGRFHLPSNLMLVFCLTEYRIIEHINKHEGVEWVTMGEIYEDFISRNPQPE